jgi:hypothetical protein
MQKVLSLLAVVTLATTSVAFAATGDGSSTGMVDSFAQPTATTTVTPTATLTPTLSAAPTVTPTVTQTVTPSLGSGLGEYKSVSCNSNPAFATNSCNQCFDGGSVKAGERLTGLFDNWTNTTNGMLIAYKDEQKTPNMVRFGNTTWTANPSDETKLWKNSTDITWIATGTGARSNYILQAGQKVRFLEADLGAGYTLEKTDKKNGDVVGMLRFPVVSHAVDATTGSEGAATTHYECASYTLSAPVAPTQTGTTLPPTVTQTKTGPETLLLILAAFFIAFGMMFSLRKRV